MNRMLAARRLVAALGALLVCAWAGLSSAQNLTVTGSLGGVSYAVERQGSTVIAGEGPHLVALNVSNPAAPVLLDRIRLGDMVRAIELSGTKAYVAASGAGLYIVDISNPAALAIDSQFDTPGTAVGLKLNAGRAFVADSESGLRIVDVSNPASPVSVGSYDTSGRAFGVAINGNAVYVADEASGLQVISISTPSNPFLVSNVPLPGRAFDVIVSGMNAYVASGTAGLQVLSIANPGFPTIQTSLDTPGTAFRFAQVGTRVFIADREGGVQIVDFPTPSSPTLAGSFSSGVDAVYDITTDGAAAWVADLRGGVRSLNVATPSSVTATGSFETATDAREVAANGSLAVVADGARGLKVLDISAPGFPAHVGTLASSGGVFQDVEIEGSTAYVAAGSEGFLIVDLSNPAAPSVIGSYAVPALGVVVSPFNVAFVTRDSQTIGELVALDISNPASPALLDSIAQGDTGRWEDPVLSGSVLYIPANDDGIQVVGYDGLTGLGFVARFDTTGESRGIDIDELLYLADYSSGLRIYEAFLGTFNQTGAFNTAGLTHDVAAMGGLAFLADGAVGVQLMNVNTPAFPVLVETLDTPGLAISINAVGAFAYLADESGGMAILSGGLPPVPPILGFPGDVIIGDLELATASATMANAFVYPNAFDLRAISIDALTPDDEIKWSFTSSDNKILINGVGPLDPGLAGIGQDDPTAPRVANRIDLNDNDPEGFDGNPFTVTFRNRDLSPIGGANIDPGAPGILPAQTRTITLFASDCTTFSAMNIVVYTANDTSDSLSGTGFTPLGGNDFTQEGDVGGDWIGGVAGGIGSTAVNSSGLCMTVPLLGDNTVLWVSPERYIELVDNTVYRVRIGASTNQSAVDAIPLWNINFDNFNTLGGGNNFGGTAWFLDVDGGAQGIGRPQGRTSFDAVITPNAVQLPQWRGDVDAINGAFTPAADLINDIRLILRVQDIGSAAILANADIGTICIANVRIDSSTVDNLQVDSVLYAPPISTATHFAETLAQTGVGGTAAIDDIANTANYQLSDQVSRKTLGPNDTSEPNLLVRLWPVVWDGDTLYRGSLAVRSDVDLDGAGPGNGTTEGADPLDAVTLLFDTTNSELGMFSWTTRGAPGNMLRAASPRLAATVGGQPQIYRGYFYGQNATSSTTPFANRLRFMGDFSNVLELFGVSGGDPFAVESLTLERISLP